MPTLASERINRESLQAIDLASLDFDGRRPEYLRLDYVPGKVALRRSDVRCPPAGVKLKRGLDRPTNVFPPDQRYIYKDTSFPWCTVGWARRSESDPLAARKVIHLRA